MHSHCTFHKRSAETQGKAYFLVLLDEIARLQSASERLELHIVEEKKKGN